MRARDDEQGSSSPVRHECNEQGHGARVQGSSPALCRGPRAMDEWAWAKARHGSRVWAASELRHNAHCLAQARAASRAASASSRATSAAPSVDRAQRAIARAQRAMARAQRAMARVHRALERAQQALASAHSERWLACVERWRARSEHHSVRWLAMGDAAAMRRAHGLRAHGQQWLCACGPWACNA